MAAPAGAQHRPTERSEEGKAACRAPAFGVRAQRTTRPNYPKVSAAWRAQAEFGSSFY
jgi:hypothetical protein